MKKSIIFLSTILSFNVFADLVKNSNYVISKDEQTMVVSQDECDAVYYANYKRNLMIKPNDDEIRENLINDIKANRKFCTYGNKGVYFDDNYLLVIYELGEGKRKNELFIRSEAIQEGE